VKPKRRREATALMKLVNDSIRDWRQFRLDDLNRLMFGKMVNGETTEPVPRDLPLPDGRGAV
jgi:hypothetical protein